MLFAARLWRQLRCCRQGCCETSPSRTAIMRHLICGVATWNLCDTLSRSEAVDAATAVISSNPQLAIMCSSPAVFCNTLRLSFPHCVCVTSCCRYYVRGEAQRKLGKLTMLHFPIVFCNTLSKASLPAAWMTWGLRCAYVPTSTSIDTAGGSSHAA